jgi:hypothetical protein
MSVQAATIISAAPHHATFEFFLRMFDLLRAFPSKVTRVCRDDPERLVGRSPCPQAVEASDR